jgi:hypothetical protein
MVVQAWSRGHWRTAPVIHQVGADTFQVTEPSGRIDTVTGTRPVLVPGPWVITKITYGTAHAARKGVSLARPANGRDHPLPVSPGRSSRRRSLKAQPRCRLRVTRRLSGLRGEQHFTRRPGRLRCGPSSWFSRGKALEAAGQNLHGLGECRNAYLQHADAFLKGNR